MMSIGQKVRTSFTTQHVLSRIPGKELAELVNDLLPKAISILDFDNETEQRVSDEKVRQ